MTPELRQALYAAFSPDDPNLGRELRILTPLEELSWDELSELEDSTGIYGSTTFKYVLPRWIELLCEDSYYSWGTSEGTFAFLIQNEKWHQWPALQVEALR